MPNYCTNMLSIPRQPGLHRADIETVMRSLRGPNGPLDFEAILPIPEALRNLCRGGTRIDGAYHTLWREEPLPGGGIRKIPLSVEEQEQLRQNHGADNPFDWCIENWGTKWNALTWEVDWAFATFRFDTAWSPPLGFAMALSRKYPGIRFELSFVETGCDMNGWIQYYQGEEWRSEDYDMNSDEGRENADRVGIILPDPEDESETVEA